MQLAAKAGRARSSMLYFSVAQNSTACKHGASALQELLLEVPFEENFGREGGSLDLRKAASLEGTSLEEVSFKRGSLAGGFLEEGSLKGGCLE